MTLFEFTGLHYRFFNATLSWTDANSSCVASAPRGYTGNLASVHHNETNTFVADLAWPGRAWLGGFKFQNNSGGDEPWMFSDGSVFGSEGYENWLAGEPSAQAIENHMEINYNEHGKWNDASEDGAGVVTGYVCQYAGKNDDIVKICNTLCVEILDGGCYEKRGEVLCGGYNAADCTKEDNAEDCAKQCYDTPACVTWTWGREAAWTDTDENCWLKTISDCSVADNETTEWVWGTKNCGKSITMHACNAYHAVALALDDNSATSAAGVSMITIIVAAVLIVL